MSEKGQYDTFDSSGGPVNKDADAAHNDASPSDQGVEHGAVPTVPQKK